MQPPDDDCLISNRGGGGSDAFNHTLPMSPPQKQPK